MKLSARADIDAPVDEVFAVVSDFDALERAALRRGIEMSRALGPGGDILGTSWDAEVRYRGKRRAVNAELTRIDPPNTLVFEGMSSGYRLETTLDLVPLSRTNTRLSISLNVTARTLLARLMLQSSKLGKARLQRQFNNRVALFAKFLETRLTHGGEMGASIAKAVGRVGAEHRD